MRSDKNSCIPAKVHICSGGSSTAPEAAKLTAMLPPSTEGLKHSSCFIYTNPSPGTLQATASTVISILEDSTSQNLLINTVAVYGCK